MSLKDLQRGSQISARAIRELTRHVDLISPGSSPGAGTRLQSGAGQLAPPSEWFPARIASVVSGGYTFVELWVDSTGTVVDKPTGLTNSSNDPAVALNGAVYAVGDIVLVRRGPGTAGLKWEVASGSASGTGFFARLTTDSGGKWKWYKLKLDTSGAYTDDGSESTAYNAVPCTIDGTNYAADAVAGMRVWMKLSVGPDGSGNPQYEFLPHPSPAFTTIAVSGQSDVVAEIPADTLTLVAGTGITLTTNAGTDTITISASASPPPPPPPPPSPSPSAPTSATAIPSLTTATLSWSAPSGAPSAATYNVYYSTSAGMTSPTLATTTASTSYTISGLTSGTTYYVGIAAVSDLGAVSSYSNIATVTPDGPTRTALGAWTANSTVTQSVTVGASDLLVIYVGCLGAGITDVQYAGVSVAAVGYTFTLGPTQVLAMYVVAGTGSAANIVATSAGGNLGVIACKVSGLTSNLVDNWNVFSAGASLCDLGGGATVGTNNKIMLGACFMRDNAGSYTSPEPLLDGQNITITGGGGYTMYEGYWLSKGVSGYSMRSQMTTATTTTWYGVNLSVK